MIAAARNILPGIVLCAAVVLAAELLQEAEIALFGRAWLEALVLAILVGTAVRTTWTPAARWQPGIGFSAKMLLEIAVMLLGAAISGQAVLALGGWMLAGIVIVVTAAIGASFGIGRVLGLPRRMALLVAVGNSICGNSAIAAVAPVIGASSKDVASSIAFTAVLGVAVVLGLPALITALHLSEGQYGVLAGLTVYAVPQVLAATIPVSVVSTQIGTLVKLIRVLMLGPAVLICSLLFAGDGTGKKPGFFKLVPWFILGFLGLMVLRTLNLIPVFVQAPAALAANILTVMAMAALGLGVDIRMVAKAGPRVTLTVMLSLAILAAISLELIFVLAVP